MHETVRVRVRQRLGDLPRDLDGVADRQRPARHASRERLAFEILHDEVVEIVLVTDVIDPADVRMLETRDRLRLAIESLAALGAHGGAAEDNFDRDRSIQPEILRTVDLAHSASAQRFDDFVGSETSAG